MRSVISAGKSPDEEHKGLTSLFTEEIKNKKVCQYQLRAEQWSQKEDHLHVDDSFSLDPFFLSFSLSLHSYHDNAHAIYFCTLGADCSSSALAAFFSSPDLFLGG